MKKYHVYGLGNALVDTEIEVTDNNLNELVIEKGLMTLSITPPCELLYVCALYRNS